MKTHILMEAGGSIDPESVAQHRFLRWRVDNPSTKPNQPCKRGNSANRPAKLRALASKEYARSPGFDEAATPQE
ncbi:MAG TPA: hypothetical protein VKP30_33030 [Polyangiaceae bacterium]|nr:hypothetical protein [Polyangiaceae bacterium]